MASQELSFQQFSLCTELKQAIIDLKYTKPTPIQAQAIPYLLSGRDIIGQAQTGTGKTVAFALPLLSLIDIQIKKPQALILVPTRELAIQVSNAIQDLAKYLKECKIAAIFGGDGYQNQIRDLRRGAQIIVSTPGRMMDHMRRKTIEFNTIEKVILDEADEMLSMGFHEDVEWILDQLPARNHTALFSATMPKDIRKMASKVLRDPQKVVIKSPDKQANNIAQRYIVCAQRNKLNLLMGILEVEETEGVIVFVRTKAQTEEIADKLNQSRFSVSAINGDMAQDLRKKTINKVREGGIKILIATDVAARGLDIDRISHVINYDAPFNDEIYVHRVGRTGRAGRSGTAILFLTPSERYLLRSISSKVGFPLEEMQAPSDKDINNIKINRFKNLLGAVLSEKNKNKNHVAPIFSTMLLELKEEHGVEDLEIANALLSLRNKENPILLDRKYRMPDRNKQWSNDDLKSKQNRPAKRKSSEKMDASRGRKNNLHSTKKYRLEVGKNHGTKARNIVGAIANEAGLSSKFIDNIKIYDDYTTVSLPDKMPQDIFKALKKVWVCGRQLNISQL